MQKRYTARHVVITIVGLIILVFVMYTSLVLRDYSISFEGGPHLVPKITVPGPPGFSVDNSVPEKITVKFSQNGGDGYEIQISRFQNMAFGKVYRSIMPTYSQGLMKGGKTYYLRARSLKTKPNTSRKLHGQWGAVRKILIRQKPTR